MKTLIEKANASSIRKAAEILKRGGLVAFPTETVYGLGANAFDSQAVKKIYLAKGRPSDNPLIVHICDVNQLYDVVANVSDVAQKLIKKFWPGPLTIIFDKKDSIPSQTSGGLDTIAVRFPSNQVAQKLIRLANLPIAAPSANISGKPSCTHFDHVVNDLDGKIDMIICDENEESFGLESTILDLTTQIPTLLRPGAITLEMIKETIGDVVVANNLINDDEHPKAPGMKYKHYSPRADVFIVDGDLKNVVAKINEMIEQNLDANKKIGVLASEQTKNLYENCFVISAGDRNNLYSVAQNLFSSLRQFDLNNIDIVYAESFPDENIGFAIMNRLSKAADYKIIKV